MLCCAALRFAELEWVSKSKGPSDCRALGGGLGAVRSAARSAQFARSAGAAGAVFFSWSRQLSGCCAAEGLRIILPPGVWAGGACRLDGQVFGWLAFAVAGLGLEAFSLLAQGFECVMTGM